MNLIESIISGNLVRFKELISNKLDEIAQIKLEEVRPFIPEVVFQEVELDEASTNIVKMGRIQKIRRRIRRNKKGRMVVQKNVRRSAVKGYRISGNTLKRISASQRIQKTRKLKRYWKSKGRAKLNRTLLKRKMSMRRRKSMGIR